MTLAIAAAAARAEPGAPPQIVGTWSLDARFFDPSIRARTGPVPSRLSIDRDLGVHGTIGDAAIAPTRPVRIGKTHAEYRIVSTRPVRDIASLRKSHLVLLLSLDPRAPPDMDFHLKSRFGFDPTMRVGHLDVLGSP